MLAWLPVSCGQYVVHCHVVFTLSAVCFSTLFSQIMETVEPWYVSKEIIPVIKVCYIHYINPFVVIYAYFMAHLDPEGGSQKATLVVVVLVVVGIRSTVSDCCIGLAIHCNHHVGHYSGFSRISPSVLNRFTPNLQA